MNFDDALIIYEILGAVDLKGATPPSFLGQHTEEDFAFLFFAKDEEQFIENLLAADKNIKLRQKHLMTYGQWQDGAAFEAFTVADLTIYPHLAKSIATDKALIIDPQSAFGFGGHPTTKAVLGFLAKVMKRHQGARVLDLGSGTGILSLAALAWGARAALMVDYSSLAVKAARENIRLNNRAKECELYEGQAQDFAKKPAEILLANLHGTLQKELFDLGAFSGRSAILLSGIFHGEALELIELMKVQEKMILRDHYRDDRWSTLFWEEA